MKYIKKGNKYYEVVGEISKIERKAVIAEQKTRLLQWKDAQKDNADTLYNKRKQKLDDEEAELDGL